LLALAERYFRTQVAGQAEGTVDAKQRDLACFLTFYTQLYGHDDRREWYNTNSLSECRDVLDPISPPRICGQLDQGLRVLPVWVECLGQRSL
jgi:hypothetical protein